MCKPLEKCRGGNDFIGHAEFVGRKKPELKYWKRNGKGTHCVIGTIYGQTVVPLHREIADGLRCKLIKSFIAIGLACLVIAIALV